MLLICSLATTAFAAGETGSITIKGVAVNGNAAVYSYTAYQMLELESYNAESKAYSYTIKDGWADFFAMDEVKAYFTVDENGYVKWNGPANETEEAAKGRAAAVSKLALAYAKDEGMTGLTDFLIVSGTVKDDKADIKLSGLDLGYYLVDSSAGALCGLTTTDPAAEIDAKNGVPTMNKAVHEDSAAADSWAKENDADIGQTVKYKGTITVQAGAENYVYHDKMSDGLAFTGVTSVTVGNTALEKDTDYKVITAPTDGCTFGCTFEVKFLESFYGKVEPGDEVVINYEAKLTADAVIGGTGNKNEAWLEYGDDKETTHDTTTTKTYGFDLVKTNTDKKLIPGAWFEIYETAEGGTPIQFVADGVEDGHNVYRVATADEIADADVTKHTNLEVVDGCIRIVGLDGDTYYLKETKAPDGYNILKNRKPIELNAVNYVTVNSDNTAADNTGFQVENKTGTELPETGATGIKIFIGVGMFTVIASGLLLVTKKRMSMIED